MKLSETLQYINLALNYPSLTYTDISLYFDMAISELNTTLHTSIPSISKMIELYRKSLLPGPSNKDVIPLTSDPAESDYNIPVYEEVPSSDIPSVFYCTEDSKFYTASSTSLVTHDTLTGVRFLNTGPEFYEAVYYGGTAAAWVKLSLGFDECELEDYLPNDWVLLWMIPYICYKYTVRDGGTAQTFAEELTQGYQQLQDTYNVPSKVILTQYADKTAYKELVEQHLPNLNILVPTLAIYESMKHERNINAIFGGFYDRGGFR